MTNVVPGHFVTKLEVPPENIISEAAKVKMQRVIIIGLTEDGDTYFGMSDGDVGTALYDIEIFKRSLIDAALS